jgi:hypothetical protein
MQEISALRGNRANSGISGSVVHAIHDERRGVVLVSESVANVPGTTDQKMHGHLPGGRWQPRKADFAP